MDSRTAYPDRGAVIGRGILGKAVTPALRRGAVDEHISLIGMNVNAGSVCGNVVAQVDSGVTVVAGQSLFQFVISINFNGGFVKDPSKSQGFPVGFRL